MKKKQKLSVVFACLFLLVIATVIGCGTAGENFLIPVGGDQVFAFVVNSQPDTIVTELTISAFSVDRTTGRLTAVPGSPFTTPDVDGRGNLFLDVTADGRFLFVPNRDANTVSVFAIGSNGALSQVGSPAATGGNDAFAVKVTPNGRFLYVANQGSGDISAFSIGTSGTLTAIGTPEGADGDVHHLFMDPQGRFLYAGIWGEGYAINGFLINADGSLTYIPDAFALTDKQPQSGTVNSTGHYLLVANAGSGDVSVFEIDQTTGALTEVDSPVAAGSRPFHVAEFSVGGATYMAVNNTNDGTISVYTFNATTGTLTATGPASDPGINFPNWIAVHPSANFAYISDNNNDNIFGFTLDATGNATDIQGSPFTGGGLSNPAQIVLTH